ncbi:hypothetical protein [Clostridium chrysemydis]|uniref:hypothetical protein n=1 Tax=Clostridium chrysemydis TaxID=2665504 RepID=UPI001883BB0C|nr:hypothetical protein [Clostridium chrysemydis]
MKNQITKYNLIYLYVKKRNEVTDKLKKNYNRKLNKWLIIELKPFKSIISKYNTIVEKFRYLEDFK